MALAGFTRRGGGGPAPCDEPQAQPRRDRGLPPALPRGLGRARRRPRDGRAGLREAARLRLVRLPEVARGRVRAARLPVGVAAPPLPGRVPLRAPERPADGLLPAREPRPGRAAAWDRGAPAGRERAATRRCALEGDAVRVGLAYVKGVGEEPARALVAERAAARPVPQRLRTSRSVRRSTAPRSRRSSPRAPATRSAGRDGSSSGGSASLRGRRARRARRRAPARAPARAADGDSRAPRAVRLGAHARRLPHDVALGRRAPARAPATASPGRGRLERSTCRAPRTASGSRWRASSSRASGRRPRTASSSCSSRTSTAR